MPKINKVQYYERQSEAPLSIPRHALVLVGTTERLKWAMFECPCGTGHKIMINLAASRNPYWRVSVDDGHPSVAPSVDFHDAHGRCHFWLRNGKVEFTPDSVRPRRRRSALGGSS